MPNREREEVGRLTRPMNRLWPVSNPSVPSWVFSIVVLPGLICFGPLQALPAAAPTFTIATFNLENYVIDPGANRPVKSQAARAKVRESIRTLNADVLGVQEVGGTNALEELRSNLKAEGLEYPHSEIVFGFDTNIQVAVLSKFPFSSRRPHAREGFLLNGRRFRMTRGIAEVDVQVRPGYSFTLFVAHLKSRRPSAEADETELREQEAIILREKIDERLRMNPEANIAVVGDLNDVKDALSTRAVVGKGKNALLDTRPAEKNGDSRTTPSARLVPRNISWTYFYGKEDTYSRIDYIFVTRAMAREWDASRSYVLALPNWGMASDHRPILASFVAEEK